MISTSLDEFTKVNQDPDCLPEKKVHSCVKVTDFKTIIIKQLICDNLCWVKLVFSNMFFLTFTWPWEFTSCYFSNSCSLFTTIVGEFFNFLSVDTCISVSPTREEVPIPFPSPWPPGTLSAPSRYNNSSATAAVRHLITANYFYRTLGQGGLSWNLVF